MRAREASTELDPGTEAKVVAAGEGVAERPADRHEVPRPQAGTSEHPSSRRAAERRELQARRPRRRREIAADPLGAGLGAGTLERSVERSSSPRVPALRELKAGQHLPGPGPHRGQVGEVAMQELVGDLRRTRAGHEVHTFDQAIAGRDDTAPSAEDCRIVTRPTQPVSAEELTQERQVTALELSHSPSRSGRPCDRGSSCDRSSRGIASRGRAPRAGR